MAENWFVCKSPADRWTPQHLLTALLLACVLSFTMELEARAAPCPGCAGGTAVSSPEEADFVCLDCGQLTRSNGGGVTGVQIRPVSETLGHRRNVRSRFVGPEPGSTRSWEIGNIFKGVDDRLTEEVGPNKELLDPYFYADFWAFTGDVYEDTFSFYSREIGTKIALAIGGAAILANTKADENFRNWYFDNVRDESTNFHWAKSLGEVGIVPPVIAITWGITEWIEANPASRGGKLNGVVNFWSRQTTRAYIQAALPTVALQWMTGASRPDEKPGKGSSWKFLDDNNGVSGHTVVGAIPFLVAARMTDDPILKFGFYFGSTFAGYSRIYDDAHYLSQVLLGYAIAYWSVEAIEMSDASGVGFRVVPLTWTGGYGLGVERRW